MYVVDFNIKLNVIFRCRIGVGDTGIYSFTISHKGGPQCLKVILSDLD